MVPQLGYQFRQFYAVLKGKQSAPSPEALRQLKEQTWEAVKESIDRGVPAIAWQPITVSQQKQGIYGAEWSLLIGYDESDKTYTARNQHYKAEFSVPYDQFGYTDPVNWYHVIVLDAPQPVDPEQVALRSLRHAVDFAHGRRYKPEEACYAVDALGFAAYELWKEAFHSGEVNARYAPDHARQLRWRCAQAATYLREIGEYMPARARPALKQAAAWYEAEVEAVDRLQELCTQGAEAGALTPRLAQEAVTHLVTALDLECKAIGQLEAILGR